KAMREAEESPIIIELRKMEQSPFMRELHALEKSSFIHDIDGFRSVSDHLAELISPSITTAPFLSIQNWQNTLSDRLGNLRLDWLDRDPARSISGFSHLARLHDSIDLNDPFSEPVIQLVNRELGEPSTYSESMVPAVSEGFNSDITAFEDDHYLEVIEIAGFEIDLPRPNAPTHAPHDGTPLTFCSKSSRLLMVLENSLRFAIKKTIYHLGKSDNQVFPGQMLERCREKQQKAKESTGSHLELIYYADFMELLSLIEGKILWNGFFQKVFRNKTDIQASMQRIHPIRIEIAHSRPVSKENLITFAVESQRVLKALERANLTI
ncbi:Swt1 family HEPN domain-containing protein, partial [Vreelandella boliviensis]|uniref:Swt1 family HEPN domain-containing protein n=1 Tax=Vreelandella boliviensis TaxID=223527 RepID=UPI001B8CDC84